MCARFVMNDFQILGIVSSVPIAAGGSYSARCWSSFFLLKWRKLRVVGHLHRFMFSESVLNCFSSMSRSSPRRWYAMPCDRTSASILLSRMHLTRRWLSSRSSIGCMAT